MDGKQFDALTKALGAGASRRGLLKTLAGGALSSAAASVGFARAEAARCRAVGNACAAHGDCCSGHCVSEGRSRKICHCGSSEDCPPRDACHAVACVSGACTNPAKANGAACDDGNACTVGDSCQAGVCQSGSPVGCKAANQCHQPGVCDPKTGQCAYADKTNGTSCNDGNPCTIGDTCQKGVCQGGAANVCAASDQCHVAGTCDPTTGTCSNPPAPDGAACGTGSTCCGGTCVNQTADSSNCGSCGHHCTTSVANGVPTCVNGTCGFVCDVGFTRCNGACVNEQTDRNNCGVCGNACPSDACTTATCSAGVCGKSPTNAGGQCAAAPDRCTNASTCDANGHCVAGGAVTCNDNNACTTDACDATLGCVYTPVECPVDEACQNGVCTPIFTCDCANLNFCSGHGVCSAECSCVCTPPYIGPTCSSLPPVACATFATCAECQTHGSDGCVFCTLTTTSAADVCVSAEECLVPQEAC